MMQDKRIVVIAGGDCRDLDFHRRQIREGDFIICADGGAAYALAMDLTPDLVVGDLDSLPPEQRRQLEALGVSFLKHPPAKEKSDLELALDRAVVLKPGEILILGALGGERVDHAWINTVLLSVPLRAGIPAKIIDEKHEIFLVERELTLTGRPGDYLSLFPLTGPVTGVVTAGLKYPLRGESLHFGSTRGLSNEFSGKEVTVNLESGLLLAIKVQTDNQSPLFPPDLMEGN